MATIDEQLLTLLNNSKKPNELPLKGSLDGTEYQVIINEPLNRLERVLVSTGGNFINIDDTIFRIEKGYTIATQNTGVGLEINDIISNGVIRNNGFTIEITKAIYIGGTITDFGTYNDTTKSFTGGSYTVIKHIKL